MTNRPGTAIALLADSVTCIQTIISGVAANLQKVKEELQDMKDVVYAGSSEMLLREMGKQALNKLIRRYDPRCTASDASRCGSIKEMKRVLRSKGIDVSDLQSDIGDEVACGLKALCNLGPQVVYLGGEKIELEHLQLAIDVVYPEGDGQFTSYQRKQAMAVLSLLVSEKEKLPNEPLFVHTYTRGGV
jgi:hypothetical protein